LHRLERDRAVDIPLILEVGNAIAELPFRERKLVDDMS
jgi:hypothetical protein